MRAHTLFLAVLALACAGCPAMHEAPPAPPFELELLSGETTSLDALRGRVVLVDFWATWCAPCVHEVPELNAVWDDFRGRGAHVLAISVDTVGRDAVAAWAREHGVQYPVALGSIELALRYGVDAFPAHLLIDGEGRIVERLPGGFHDRQELARALERALAG